MHVKAPYCIGELKGGKKTAVLETVYDSLQHTYHRLLPICVSEPVSARPQSSYVKIHLEYFKRDLDYVKRAL